MFKYKKIFTFFLLFVVYLASTATAVSAQQPKLFDTHPPQPIFAKAQVLNIVEINTVDNFNPIKQIVTLKILNTKYKGQIITIDHLPLTMAGMKIKVSKGDKVIIMIDENPSLAESPDGTPLFAIADFARAGYVRWLIIIYAILILIIGRIKGLKALISLTITLLLLFMVLVPLTFMGYNPIFITILISLVVSVITFRIIGGKTIKTLSATLGTLSGIIIAGIVAYLFGKMMHLTGMATEEAKILLYSLNVKINFESLLFSGIIIGALGAIMDIGMSIASSVNEVRKIHPKSNFHNLYKSGMRVGRDIMGTMANTLILAYTGGALPLLLLIIASQSSLSKVINLELITLEVLRAMAGSIGLVLCIPITSTIAAYFYSRQKSPKKSV